jgi:hypothetical protein
MKTNLSHLSLIFIALNFLFWLSPNSAKAQCVTGGYAFTCFDQEDADKVFKDLTSAFAPTTVSGASSLGKVFGVELGLVVSASQAPNTQEVIDSYGSDFDIPGIPMAGISGIVTLPYGIGIESTIIPKIDIGDEGSFESLNLGARWTITDMFPMGLLKIAVRSSLIKSKATFNYEEDGGLAFGTVNETADFDIEVFEVGAVIGLNFKVVEPYIGASDLQAKGNIFATGTSSIQGNLATIDEDAEAAGIRAYAGVLFKLPLLRIGAEVATFEDVARGSVKIAFKF